MQLLTAVAPMLLPAILITFLVGSVHLAIVVRSGNQQLHQLLWWPGHIWLSISLFLQALVILPLLLRYLGRFIINVLDLFCK